MSTNLNRSLSSSYLTSISRWSIALSLTLSTFLATQSLPLAHAQSPAGPTSPATATPTQENYNPKFKAKSEHIKNWFNTELETVRNSYVLTRFVDQHLQATEGAVTCRQLGDFQYALSPQERRTLIEEVDRLTKKPGSPTAYACPFVSRDSQHTHKNVNFYNTQHGRLLNFLELVAFAKTNNTDWFSLYQTRQTKFHNDRLKLQDLTFCNVQDPINVRRWQAQIYAEVLAKLEAEVAPRLAEASENFEAIKDTLFIPEQVFQGPQKIFFAINTCPWSKRVCMTAQNSEQTTNFQDYAFMHIKALLPFLDPETQISIGFIDHDKTYLRRVILKPEQLSQELQPYNTLESLIDGWRYNNYLKEGYTSKIECIADLYQSARGQQRAGFDYVLFFTDGYGNRKVDSQAVAADPKTIFLFKGLSLPKTEIFNRFFSPYIKRVARPGHDIVLNSKFEFPRYDEYFDRKAAIDVYQLLMQQVQDMKAAAQIP